MQKEARLKETFFRRLNQRIVQEIEKGSNILLSDDDWEDIVQNADIIFDNFTRRLQQHYPALNKEDLPCSPPLSGRRRQALEALVRTAGTALLDVPALRAVALPKTLRQ